MIRYIRLLVIITFITSVLAPVSVSAVDSGTQPQKTAPHDFYSSNDILFYDRDAAACTVGGSSPISAGDNKDYKGRPVFTDEQLQKIQQYQATYQAAGNKAGVPWQMLAVAHTRETGLSMTNPNDDGLFQYVKKSYPQGSVSQENFQRMADDAASLMAETSGSKKDLLKSGDAAAVKDVFFSYNGRAAVYVKQAKQLGFTDGADGSPYVMNKADEKRDPDVAPAGTWGQIKVDGGAIEYPANGDYGAFVQYSALTGASFSSSGSCGGSSASPGVNGWDVTGPNAMTVYYQNKSPWNTQNYGPGTIEECGCGPTSTSMAVASLLKDNSITPKTMADFFVSNGGQYAGCASTWSLWNSSSALAKKHNLSITDLGTDITKVSEFVKGGGFVIMSQGAGMFTNCGHILLIRGVTDSGNFLLADPNSEKYTTNEQGFTKEQIVGQERECDPNGKIKSTATTGNLSNLWGVRKL